MCLVRMVAGSRPPGAPHVPPWLQNLSLIHVLIYDIAPNGVSRHPGMIHYTLTRFVTTIIQRAGSSSTMGATGDGLPIRGGVCGPGVGGDSDWVRASRPA